MLQLMSPLLYKKMIEVFTDTTSKKKLIILFISLQLYSSVEILRITSVYFITFTMSGFYCMHACVVKQGIFKNIVCLLPLFQHSSNAPNEFLLYSFVVRQYCNTARQQQQQQLKYEIYTRPRRTLPSRWLHRTGTNTTTTKKKKIINAKETK